MNLGFDVQTKFLNAHYNLKFLQNEFWVFTEGPNCMVLPFIKVFFVSV